MADATSMFDPLSDAEATTETKASHRGAGGDWTPILPPSAAAPDDFEHPKLGTPSIVWEYHNKSGELEGYQCRFDLVDDDGKPDKTFRPYRYGTLNGRTGWHWRKGWGDKRPLYRLPDILARPDAQVRIFEGEKAADAAQVLFPDCVTTTPMNGAKSPGKTDYKPLAGRIVVAWADNDEPGIEFAWEIERLALEAGAETVDVFQVPVYFPSGWDWADPMPEGWTTEKLLELPPASRPPMGETGGIKSRAGDETARRRNWPFKPKEDGVYKLVENKDQETEWRWFCSSLEVAAVTRDHNGEAWGRLLIVTDRDGAKHEWAMPMKMLAADGAPYREHLLSLGLEIAPGRFAKDALHEYIATAQPEERARCVPRTGWHGCTYVLPDITYGQTEGERVLLQTASMEHAFRLVGSLEDWQENLGQYCVGNSRLVLAVSAAFAAPLLIIASEESGGINFVGPSRTGKTTALRVAGSVWGGGGITGYLRTWRATSNGLESIAQSHCDALLALDEMGQVDPREAGEVAYMLANGAGKSRAKRDGSARPPAEWRVLFLSTGEMGLADKMIEGGKRPRAGQEVRLVDVPSDAGAGLGIFEEVHGFASSEVFARHLGTRAMKFYGAPIRIFLEKVTAVEFTAIGDALKMARDDFMAAYVPEDKGGRYASQLHRASSGCSSAHRRPSHPSLCRANEHLSFSLAVNLG